MSKNMKVAVIGGGVSGLLVTKHAKSLNLDVTCFEQTNQTGGIWVYSEQSKNGMNGLKVHSAMYKNLKTNVPKQLMGFQDFQISNNSDSSFMTGFEMYDFLKSYEEHFNLGYNIKLEHSVAAVTPIENLQWKLSVINLATNEKFEETFDAVFVCNGHYSDAAVPKINGVGYFKGETIHSRDYRRPEKYSGKNVLVIGAGPSGIDIVHDVSTAANTVYFSHHSKIDFSGYPENVVQKTDVTKILPDGTVQFSDDSIIASLDAIIFCTGYNYKFSFLSPECGISVDDNHIKHLYKHVINIKHPTMFFIGIPFVTINSFTMEYQTLFSLHWLLNTEKRPTELQMIKDTEEYVQERIVNGIRKKHMHQIGVDEIAEYLKSLSDFGGFEPLKPVFTNLYRTGYRRLMNDPLNFRRYKYTLIDGEGFSEEYK